MPRQGNPLSVLADVAETGRLQQLEAKQNRSTPLSLKERQGEAAIRDAIISGKAHGELPVLYDPDANAGAPRSFSKLFNHYLTSKEDRMTINLEGHPEYVGGHKVPHTPHR